MYYNRLLVSTGNYTGVWWEGWLQQCTDNIKEAHQAPYIAIEGMSSIYFQVITLII